MSRRFFLGLSDGKQRATRHFGVNYPGYDKSPYCQGGPLHGAYKTSRRSTGPSNPRASGYLPGMSKYLEAKAVSHVFSPGFSAICHLWLMLGSEPKN